MKNSKNQTSDCKNVSSEKQKHDAEAIRQQARYSTDGRPAPDNNIFDEGRSNPLSSKGN